MRKRTTIAAISAALALAALDFASAAHAAPPGTFMQITFEGICGKKKQKSVPNGYDGFNWSGMTAIGIDTDEDPGYLSVVRGKIAVRNEVTQSGSSGEMQAPVAFSLKSGHFAACCGQSAATTFLGYHNGFLVGQLSVTLNPVDTKIVFDSTFAEIDQLEIQTSGANTGVFMDNLIVKY